MIPPPDVVALIHRQRVAEIERSYAARLIAGARACCRASASLLRRLLTVRRPEPQACGGCR